MTNTCEMYGCNGTREHEVFRGGCVDVLCTPCRDQYAKGLVVDIISHPHHSEKMQRWAALEDTIGIEEAAKLVLEARNVAARALRQWKGE